MRKVLRLPALRFRHEYFIFLLPLFFVVHGYRDHYGEVPAIDAFFLALEYMVAAAATTLILAFLLRSVRKAAVFTVLFFGFYFFFGAAHDWLKKGLEDSFLVSYSFILPFSAVAFIFLGFYFWRTARAFNRLTRYFNTILLLLLMIEGVMLLVKRVEAGSPVALTVPVAQMQPLPAPLCDTCFAEDIHLIIADEYAGTEALKEALKFDNTPFEDSLRRRGFYVVDNPRSNYNYTVASMASLFQMDYLPDLTNKTDKEIYYLSASAINQNKFGDFLISRGYTLKNFSIFDFAGQPAFDQPYFPQGLELITDHTFFARVKNDIGYHLALTYKIPSEVERFKKYVQWEAGAESRKMDSVLKEVSTPHPGSRFFYTHLLMPHEHYYYDKAGNPQYLESLLNPQKSQDERVLYLEYLQYTNKKLLQFIDGIRRRSAKPPVILLLGDHGFRHDSVPNGYHFSTINAVFIPGGQEMAFNRGMSNVNLLRTLLNIKFGQQLLLLPDSSVFLKSVGTE